jgi:hypothetical protein
MGRPLRGLRSGNRMYAIEMASQAMEHRNAVNERCGTISVLDFQFLDGFVASKSKWSCRFLR